MHGSIFPPRALLLLLGVTLLIAAAGRARAGEDEEGASPSSATPPKMRVYVKTKDGETVKMLKMVEDGTWVVVEEGKEGEGPIRLRLAGVPHGATIVAKQLETEKAAAKEKRSPLSTLLRWLIEESHKEADPLDAWFAAGDDVPFAHLRNMLKADGWDADALRKWVHHQVKAHLDAWLKAHAKHGGRAASWAASAHPPCAHPGRCPCACGCRHGRSGHAAGGGWGRGMSPGPRAGPWGHGWWGPPPQVRTERQAYVLWNDGSGWHHQTLPQGPGWTMYGPWMGPPPGAGGCARCGAGGGSAAQPHEAPSGAVEGLDLSPDLPPEAMKLLRDLLQGAATGSERESDGPESPRRWAAQVARSASPFLVEMFKDLPPEARQALLRQMTEIGSQILGAMEDPAQGPEASDCGSCPKGQKCPGCPKKAAEAAPEAR